MARLDVANTHESTITDHMTKCLTDYELSHHVATHLFEYITRLVQVLLPVSTWC